MQEINREFSGSSSVDHASGRPPTLVVVVLLVVVALLFSYLGAYNVSAALVTADLLAPWPPGDDPRPKWLVTAFLSVVLIFATAGVLMRFASCRSLRDLDRLADDD
jgi:hypothetical protein